MLHSRTKTLSALSGQLRLFRVRWRKRLWSFFSVVRASLTNEDFLSTLRGFAAVSGSLGEASLSSISVVRASFTNKDAFGTFRAVAAVSGSLEAMSLVFHTCNVQKAIFERFFQAAKN